MDNQGAPTAKQSKGIKKLWIKLKASMKSDQAKSSQKSTAPKASTPTTSTTSAPVAPKTVTESMPQQVPESSAAPAQTVAQPESKKIVEETKPVSEPSMPLEAIQVDDEEEDYDEKIQLPQMKTISVDKETTSMRYQRAQDIFKKYNLELEPAEWQQVDNSAVPRVEKKTRMRVRYTCHECKQTFGRERKCSNCSHMRCNSCVRYPAKRTGDKARSSKPTELISSATAAPTTGSCHECKTAFNLGDTECENCNHQICSRCLKETIMTSPATAPPAAQPIAAATAS